ncbi:uncharacterized protein LOC115991399 [Quercus lobata]|uniref:uncharacterized protein LOC115991399 n=1 Tax=Quercus lobata TaxID=97700 RepID=UPI0012458FBA|nr:uncharacterized protein LOC115991399 [Quercus lobata]
MARDPTKRNQNLYCQYHQEPGHTIKNCRNLKNHLDQLIREGKLSHLLHYSSGRQEQMNVETWRDTLRPAIGTINVILTAPRRTNSHPSRVMSVARLPAKIDDRESKKAKRMALPMLGFSNEDNVRTIQPHDDVLVIILRIVGYDVKRVLVDQGSAVKVMYLNLYKGLNLKPEDLTVYNSPLVSFEGKTVTPVKVMYLNLYKGLNLKPEDLTVYNSPLVSFEGKTVTPRSHIRLPIQIGSNIMELDFIVVDAYSPYTAIVARPWLHALGAVSSTLHQKVKYPLEGQVKEVIRDQAMAQQCMVSAIS